VATKTFKDINVKGIRSGDLFGQWELAAGDEAQALICPRYNDKSVQILGDFDGATVNFLITNDPSLQSWHAAYDFEGVNISQTAERKPWVILPNVYAMKPEVVGGGPGTNISVVIVGKGVGV
jgi:hypothetical protein